MIRETFVVKNETGLHMRPGRLVVQEAKKYTCEITITRSDGRSANAKSLVKLIKLAINKGTEITLACDGEDEEVAVVELERFITSLTE